VLKSLSTFVDGFPRRSDELGELFLGEVVDHPGCVSFFYPELVSQPQNQLGDPARHVGEYQLGSVVLGAPQPAGQYLEQLLAEGGTTCDPCQQRFAWHHRSACVCHGGGRAASRSRVDGARFAEHVRGTQ
jgi:hypothetical protein